MTKYKFVFNTCECSNCSFETNEQAVEAAKRSLVVMHKVNPLIHFVMVAKVIGCGHYSIIGCHEL